MRSLKIRESQTVSADTARYSNSTGVVLERHNNPSEGGSAERFPGWLGRGVSGAYNFHRCLLSVFLMILFSLTIFLSLSVFFSFSFSFEIPVAGSFVMLKYTNASVTY